MSTGMLKAAVIGGIAGAVMAIGTAAIAGTGIGGIFNLGVDNTVDGQTQLHGNTGGNPQLRVNNQQGTDAAIGVPGVHSAAEGGAAGIQGETSSTAAGANGVFGRAAATGAAGDSNGVKGVNNGAGRGVYGQGKTGPGVYGNSTSGYGVWGIGSYGLVGGGSQGGVWGSSASGSGVYGVHLRGEWNPGRRVRGNELGVSERNRHPRQSERDQCRPRQRRPACDQQQRQPVRHGRVGIDRGIGLGSARRIRRKRNRRHRKARRHRHGRPRANRGRRSRRARDRRQDRRRMARPTDPAGYAFAAQGDAGQNRSSGGWVKAMAFIDPSYPAGQQVRQCFNSQLPPQANCGITATGVDLGDWLVGFGFDVSDRFLSVTPVATVNYAHRYRRSRALESIPRRRKPE